MKSIYIIRHAQSLANTGAKSMPDKTVPITEQGIEQAQKLCADWQNSLPTPSAIYCSQMLRTQQTAQPFCEHYQLAAQPLELLNELSCLGFATVKGLMGKERSKIAQQYWLTADLNHRDADDADTFAEFLARIDGFIKAASTLPHNSLCFSHGQWIGLLAWRLLGCRVTNNADIQKFRQFQTAMPMYNTVVYRLDISDDGVMQLKAGVI